MEVYMSVKLYIRRWSWDCRLLSGDMVARIYGHCWCLLGHRTLWVCAVMLWRQSWVIVCQWWGLLGNGVLLVAQLIIQEMVLKKCVSCWGSKTLSSLTQYSYIQEIVSKWQTIWQLHWGIYSTQSLLRIPEQRVGGYTSEMVLKWQAA